MTRITQQQRADHVPRQRLCPGSVLLLLYPGEPQSVVVRAASRAAAQRQEPLLILMMTPEERVEAHCLARLDTALQLARDETPGLDVRVQTVCQGSRAEISDLFEAHPLLVASQDTWWRLSGGGPADRAGGAKVLLVGPES